MRMTRPILLLLAVGAAAGCEGGGRQDGGAVEGESVSNLTLSGASLCGGRFDRVLAKIPEGASPTIDATFRLPNEPEADLMRRIAGDGDRRPDLHYVHGDVAEGIRVFEARPVGENGALLLSEETNLFRTVLPGATAAAAVEEGCSRERNEGLEIVSLRVSYRNERAAD